MIDDVTQKNAQIVADVLVDDGIAIGHRPLAPGFVTL